MSDAKHTPLERCSWERFGMFVDDDGIYVRYDDLDPLTKAAPALLAALERLVLMHEKVQVVLKRKGIFRPATDPDFAAARQAIALARGEADDE